MTENTSPPEFSTLHFDGSKARGGSEAGVGLKSPQGDKLFYVLQIHFTATNNISKYEAVLHGIFMDKNIGISRLMCYGDSDLVAQQVSDICNTNKHMAAYKAIVDELSKSFEDFEVQHIPRGENEEADALSRIGSARKQVPDGIFLEHLRVPSIVGVDEDYPTKSDSSLIAVLV